MNYDEATATIASMTRLWPDWTPEQAEIDNYRRGFAPHGAVVAGDGVFEAWKLSKNRAPTPGAIFSAIKEQAARAGGAISWEDTPDDTTREYSQFCVICHDGANRGIRYSWVVKAGTSQDRQREIAVAIAKKLNGATPAPTWFPHGPYRITECDPLREMRDAARAVRAGVGV